MWLAIISFIIIFSLVVFVHEIGHFYFARRAGVRVEEFGFGLPPRLWGRKKGGTIYSINAIPFGGFVRLYGEGDEFRQEKQAFSSKKPWPKLTIVVGGVLMNLLFGLIAMMIGFWSGMPPLITPVEKYVADPARVESQIVVVGLVDNSAAAKAGLLPGDFIISSGNQSFILPSDFQNYIQAQVTKPIQLLVKRSNQELSVQITPLRNSDGKPEIGVLIDRNVEKANYVWWQVPWFALQETLQVLWLVAVSIGGLIYKLFTTASLPAELSGPVGIAKITADVVQLGWFRVLQFIIFLSLNLGVVNLVPFPGLDGGRLIFVLVEFFRKGKNIPGHIENAINTAGFLLLILLIAVVTYKDIMKLI